MTLEEIKNYFCIDDQHLNELKSKFNIILVELKSLSLEMQKSKEYIEYINSSSDNEKENKEKFLNTELGKKISSLTDMHDIIKKQIETEEQKVEMQKSEGKLDIHEFEKINSEIGCEHLYYVQSGENLCIKCASRNSESVNENIEQNDAVIPRKKYNERLLRIQLASYYNVDFRKYEMVSDFIQSESLDYILDITSNILLFNPSISNKDLQRRLEVVIAKLNIKFIEEMYPDENDMNSEVRQSYETYKKHL